jgi:hypothetical protein
MNLGLPHHQYGLKPQFFSVAAEGSCRWYQSVRPPSRKVAAENGQVPTAIGRLTPAAGRRTGVLFDNRTIGRNGTIRKRLRFGPTACAIRVVMPAAFDGAICADLDNTNRARPLTRG